MASVCGQTDRTEDLSQNKNKKKLKLYIFILIFIDV